MLAVSDKDAVQIDLSDDERSLLRAGLLEWKGPTEPSDSLAVAMGFTDVQDLSDQVRRLRAAIEDRQPLTMENWRRALLATEIAFVDDVFGSGLDCRITTGFPDEVTLTMLRALQRKMPRWRGARPQGPSGSAG